jgi:DNA-directed RNA polymerase specialized sigma24 family protein
VTSATRRIARNDALTKFLLRVQALDEDDRALLVHCGLEGLTAGEAAERLGISRDAAAKRWQRLKAQLVEQRAPDGLIELAE